MKQKTLDNLLLIVFAIGLLILGISLFYNAFFNPANNSTITFNITGIVNTTNATTLTQLHFECIKYCASEQDGDYNRLNSCYNQCAMLGSEEFESCINKALELKKRFEK